MMKGTPRRSWSASIPRTTRWTRNGRINYRHARPTTRILYNGKEALQQWRDTNFLRFVTFNESNVPTGLNLYEYFSFGNNAALQPVAYLVFLRLKSTILTEAAVERLFSFAKATLSDLRTRLSPELFEAMVFVAQNADQLEFTWEEVFDEYKKLLREAAAAAAAAT